jgi:hypothetical protein
MMPAAGQIQSDLEWNRRGNLSPNQAAYALSWEYDGPTVASFFVPIATITLLGSVAATAYLESPKRALLILVLGIGPVVGGWWWVLPRLRALSESNARVHKVRAVEGFIAWTGTAWAAYEWTPRGPTPIGPPPPPGVVVFALLPPGPYRFYVYRDRVRGDQIVGAESPLGPGGFSIAHIGEPPTLETVGFVTTQMSPLPVGDPLMLLSAIAQTAGFTSDELDANRRGQLSAAQERANARAGVACFEGPVQLRSRVPHGTVDVRHFVMLAGTEVPISAALAGVVVPGLRYRVYRSTRDGRLLSLEPIPGQP